MPRQVVARLLLVCAILLAQQTALAHDFWHAASSQAAGETKKNSKCDLHDLLGTVLGAVSGLAVSHDFPAFEEARYGHLTVRRAQSAPLSPHSRSPPQIS
jgi:hypothetical protein